MGRLSTIGMIEQGGTSDAILHWHLTSNHFPPLIDAVGFARLAIEAVEAGNGHEPLDDGERRASSAFAVVESWHLEDFVTDPFNVFEEFGPDE